MINTRTEIQKIIQNTLTDYKKKIRELSEKKKAITDKAVKSLENKKNNSK